jgi:hypothetical protein
MSIIESDCPHKMLIVKDSEYNDFLENVQTKFHVTQPFPLCFVCEKSTNTEYDIESNTPLFEDTSSLLHNDNIHVKSLYFCNFLCNIYRRLLLCFGIKQMTD